MTDQRKEAKASPNRSATARSRVISSKRHADAAFSIIELLAAMTILVMIVGLMAMMLTRARDLWVSTQDKQTCLAEARAALDMVAADLEQSTFSTNHQFVLSVETQRIAQLDLTFSRIYHVRLAHPGGRTSGLSEIDLRVESATNAQGIATGKQRLVRRAHLLTADQGSTPLLKGPDEIESVQRYPMAEGVVSFLIGAVDASGDFNDLLTQWDSLKEETPGLPQQLDLYLELLPPSARNRAAQLSGQQRESFNERHVMRFTRRISIRAAPAIALYARARKGVSDD